MAPNNKASVEEGDDNGVAASGRFKIQMLLGSLSFVFFFLSLHYFDKGIVRESDPTKWDLMLIYSAFTLPTLVFTMSWARYCLATNHPKWCFVVEMFQASISFLTMTGSIQISIMKDEEENFLCCLGFLLASLILLEITIDDTEDCGVSDMLLALFLTKLNTKHPKYVPIVSAISYYSKKVGTFMMKKLKNERAEAKEEEVEKLREELRKAEKLLEELREELRKAEELREMKERVHKNVLGDMTECWVATKEMLVTGPHESDLEMKYAKFFRMRGLIHSLNGRAVVD